MIRSPFRRAIIAFELLGPSLRGLTTSGLLEMSIPTPSSRKEVKSWPTDDSAKARMFLTKAVEHNPDHETRTEAGGKSVPIRARSGSSSASFGWVGGCARAPTNSTKQNVRGLAEDIERCLERLGGWPEDAQDKEVPRPLFHVANKEHRIAARCP